MIGTRQATEDDVERIRDIFVATYGSDYAHPAYYDLQLLKQMVFDDNTVLLVAEDDDSGEVLGTASVLLEVGSHEDLLGEFGRLAVHPDGRHRGIGGLLMEGRLECVRERLHVAIVDNRVSHPFSQRISLEHGFVPVGFLPLKLRLNRRESLAVFTRFFDDALALRRNNPRIVPEAHKLAGLALANCGLPHDPIVDDSSASYPPDRFRLDELTTTGYSALLRVERGRVRSREIFGPVRLHYGLFKLRATRSNYLIALDGDEIVGGVGFAVDPVEKTARIFELVSIDDRPKRFLLESLEERCLELGVEYVEADVSADAPSMQRTLLELGYVPAAYLPAAAFQDVERIDIIRMVRLLVPPDVGDPVLVPEAGPIAETVTQAFANLSVLPRLAETIPAIGLFDGLTDEQARRLASLCGTRTFAPGETILTQGHSERLVYLVIDGSVTIEAGSPPREIGVVGAGESLGEMSLLSGLPASASARARTNTDTAVLDHNRLRELVRLRPDIALVIYRNFARDVSSKLRRMSEH